MNVISSCLHCVKIASQVVTLSAKPIISNKNNLNAPNQSQLPSLVQIHLLVT